MAFHNSKKIRLTDLESLYDVELTHIRATWKLFKPHGTRHAKDGGVGLLWKETTENKFTRANL